MFSEVKSKWLFAIFVSFILGFWLAYGQIKWSSVSDIKNNKKDLLVLPDSNPVTLENKPDGESKISTVTAELEDKKPYLNDGDAYKINNWRMLHGYYTAETLAEYNTYDISTLSKLSQSGDVRAMQLLAFMKLSDGEFDAAFGEYMHAAMHGSTYALTAASEFYENKYILTSTEEEKSTNAVNALALLKVAVMRGDVLVENIQIKMFKRLRNFSPTQEQEALIMQKAEEIYKHLESERIALGLGKFDNSTTTEVDKLAAMVNNFKG